MVKLQPREALDQFFVNLRPFHYKKGEMILRAGEPSSSVFYIKKGFVRAYSLSKKGEELTLIIFKSGNFFPTMSVMTRKTVAYYMEAMTPCEILRCPRQDFLEFVKDNPDVLLDLMSRVLTRFGGILQRMEYLVFGNAGAKIASIILICAERFGKREGNKKIIEVPLTHSDIASLVGLTRETVSIEIKKLVDEGLVGYRGRQIVVKSLGGLKKRSLLD